MKSEQLPTWVKAAARAGMALSIGLGLAASPFAAHAKRGGHDKHDDNGHVMWVNHFDLLSGDTVDLATSFNSTSAGVGGLTGLVISSLSSGEDFPAGGDKVVRMALDLPKETKITGVRVCYEYTDPASFISQISLAQVNNPPSTATVLLDDTTDLLDPGPVCVNSEQVQKAIKAKKGPIILSLRVNTASPDDAIVIHGLGVFVK